MQVKRFLKQVNPGRMSSISSWASKWLLDLAAFLFVSVSFFSMAATFPVSLRVGIYNNPPLSFLDEEGKPQGVVVDLLTEVARREGWQLEYIPCEWAACLQMLENGQIDLLGAIAYTEERARRFDFNTQTYFSNWGAVYSRPGEGVQSLLELDGKVIAWVEEDIYAASLRELLSRLGLQAVWVAAPDYDAVFAMIESGQADVGVVARLFGLVNENRYKVKVSPIILSPIQLRYATTRGTHAEVLHTIDAYLAAWKDEPNSPYSQALNHWLNHHPHEMKIPAWLVWALVGLVTWGLVAMFAVGFLRRRIDAQTKDLHLAEARLRALVANVPAIIYTESTTEPGKTLYVSPYIESFLGYTAEDWLNEKYGWKKFVHPDDLEAVVAKEDRTASVGEPFCSEYRLITKDGKVVWVRDEAALVRDEGGRPLFWQGVMFDITERKRAEEDVRRHLSELEALYENGLAISRLLDPHLIGQKLVRTFSHFLSWEHITIRLRRGESDDLDLIAFTQPDLTDENREDVRQRFNALVGHVGEGLSGWVMQTGELMRVGNVREHPQFADTHPNIKSGIYAPLKIAERIIGSISVESETLNAFSEQDERLLATFAAQAAVAFENARLYQEVVQDLKQWTVLHRTSQEIVSYGLELEALYLAIHRAVSDLMPADVFSLALLDEDRQEIEGSYFVRYGKRYPPIRFKRDEGIAGYVIQNNKSLRVDDYQQKAHEIPIKPVLMDKQTYPSSILAVPLHFGTRVIGALSVQSYCSGVYSARDQTMLEMMAAYAGYALENARLFAAERKQRLLSETLREALAVGASLASSLEFNVVLDRLLETLERVIPFDGGCIMLVEAAHDTIRVARTRGYDMLGPDAVLSIQRLAFKISETANLRWMYENRKPLVIPDVEKYPGWVRVRDLEFTRSWAGAPIIIDDEVAAFFSLDSQKTDFFTQEQVLLLNAFTGQASLALQNARLFEQTRRRADELAALIAENQRLLTETQRRLQFVSALHSIDQAIVSNLDVTLIMGLVLDQALSHLGVDAAAVYLLNPHLNQLEFAVGRGSAGAALHAAPLRLNDPMVSTVILERKMVQVNLTEGKSLPMRQVLAAAEGFVFYAACPLIIKGVINGLLEVFHRGPVKPDSEWLEYFQTLAGQLAVALDTASMFSDLQRTNIELALAYDAVIEGWSEALDLRDGDTEGHTQRVTDLTLRLARQMGLSEAELIHVRRGALLHDIGKMGVPDSILRKPGPLDEEEQRIMRRHPVYAFELLSKIEHLRSALDIPYCHHEKWDGSGYPRGLKGEQIPLAARIFAIVDVWDALTSDRPYRQAWSKEDALDYIVSRSGKHFDPQVVQAFVAMLRSE